MLEIEDKVAIRDLLSSWDKYQTIKDRLDLFSKAFLLEGDDSYFHLRANLNHEGTPKKVAHEVIWYFDRDDEGNLVKKYLETFRKELDESKPQDMRIKNKLDKILKKYNI